MTPSEFRAVCIELWGASPVAPCAQALGVSSRAVRRWASGRFAVPRSVVSALLATRAARIRKESA